MEGLQVNGQDPLQLGEEWIQTVIEKDFKHLEKICHPEVISRLMTPKRIVVLENVSDLVQKVETWFGECNSIYKEDARVGMVGEKLAIFYRLGFKMSETPFTAEQQLYCSLQDGRIDQLSLLCSGFQPVQSAVDIPTAQAVKRASTLNLPTAQSSLPIALFQVDAYLEVDAAGGLASTCAILTPAIKHKLGEMNSGQVLEILVDDPSAKEDIEAWCRLSGNQLLKMERGADQELRFYLMKK